MFGDLVLFGEIVRMWYAVPLVLVISLVYGATRHELPKPILEHALRQSGMIIVFMGILFAVIWFVSSNG